MSSEGGAAPQTHSGTRGQGAAPHTQEPRGGHALLGLGEGAGGWAEGLSSRLREEARLLQLEGLQSDVGRDLLEVLGAEGRAERGALDGELQQQASGLWG